MPTTKKATVRKPTRKPAPVPPTFHEVMAELERSGSEQTRKTYARHGVVQPMFGVSFATLKTLLKRIGVDHEMALQLWDTGNFDARNLAVKIVDPGQMTVAQLDAWALDPGARMCSGYVAHVAVEGPHAQACVKRWLAAANETKRCVGWGLVCALAMREPAMDDDWFARQLVEIEGAIHKAPNSEREAMNHALIAIGSRNAGLRMAAMAAAQRIGKVEVDHGDTACKTPDAAAYIDKVWGHAQAKGFDSPAAQERKRESMRTRC
jgi:3-methyladenine DNA glycosylase AlkD